MDTTTQNHYEVLGVSPDATEAEIKRAWARKVREHPPDKDAAGNQRINQAKQVLLDPKARARYDAHLEHGDEIRDLYLEAMFATEIEDHSSAAAALRKAVALAPEDDHLRNLWALATKRAGDTAGAVRILRGLVRRAPDVTLYLYNLATMLMEIEDADQEERLAESLRLLKQAVQLEPHNSDYLIALAQCHMRMGDMEAAEQAIESAIMTDGMVNVQDLEALFELPMIHILAGQKSKIAADLHRILDLITDLSEDGREYCAYRFALLAAHFMKLKEFQHAKRCANAAVRCAPNDEEIKTFRDHARTMCKADAEFAKLDNDYSIPTALKHLLAPEGWAQLETIEPEDLEASYKKAIADLFVLNPMVLKNALTSAKEKYPTLYSFHHEIFDTILDTVRQHLRASAFQQRMSNSPQSTGCSTLALAILGMIVLFLMM